MRAAAQQGSKLFLGSEGSEFYLPLQGAGEYHCHGVAHPCFQAAVLLHSQRKAVVADAQQVAVSKGFELVSRWLLQKEAVNNARERWRIRKHQCHVFIVVGIAGALHATQHQVNVLFGFANAGKYLFALHLSFHPQGAEVGPRLLADAVESKNLLAQYVEVWLQIRWLTSTKITNCHHKSENPAAPCSTRVFTTKLIST